MNSTTTPRQPALPPEHWIVVSDDPARMAHYREELQLSADRYVCWRRAHGLVEFAAPDALADVLRAALARGAPQVHLFHDLADEAVYPWLGSRPAQQDADRLRIARLLAPSILPLPDELRRPDGLVESAWLFGGRRSRPEIDDSGRDESFARGEREAFEQWSEAFVSRHGSEELDAIYGSGAPAELEQGAPDQPQPDTIGDAALPSLQLVSFSALFADGLDQRHARVDDEALPLAAASADAAELLTRLELRPDASRRSTPDGRVEIYSQPVPDDESRRRIKIEVSLWGPRWDPQADRVLALLPARRRPVLFHLPADGAWETWHYGTIERRVATAETTIDAPTVEALRTGALRLY